MPASLARFNPNTSGRLEITETISPWILPALISEIKRPKSVPVPEIRTTIRLRGVEEESVVAIRLNQFEPSGKITRLDGSDGPRRHIKIAQIGKNVLTLR